MMLLRRKQFHVLKAMVGNNLNDVQLQQLVDRTILQVLRLRELLRLLLLARSLSGSHSGRRFAG